MTNQESEELLKHRTYREYKESQKTTEKILSELEWLRKKNEELYAKEMELARFQKAIFQKQSETATAQSKQIGRMIKSSGDDKKAMEEYRKKMAESFKASFKHAIGLNPNISISKSPLYSTSKSIENGVLNLTKLAKLPDIFIDIEKGIFLGIKQLSHAFDGVIGKMGLSYKSWRKDSTDRRFLRDNDPRFSDMNKRDAGLAAKNYLKERKEAELELQTKSERLRKLKSFGGSDSKLEEEVSVLSDYLAGKFEEVTEQVVQKVEKAEKSSSRRVNTNSSGGEVEWLQTIDKTITNVVFSTNRIDSRLVQLNGNFSDFVLEQKRNRLADEEWREKQDKKTFSGGNNTSSTVINNQSGGIFDTILGGIGGLMGWLPSVGKVIGGLGTAFKLIGRVTPVLAVVTGLLTSIDIEKDLLKPVKSIFESFQNGEIVSGLIKGITFLPRLVVSGVMRLIGNILGWVPGVQDELNSYADSVMSFMDGSKTSDEIAKLMEAKNRNDRLLVESELMAVRPDLYKEFSRFRQMRQQEISRDLGEGSSDEEREAIRLKAEVQSKSEAMEKYRDELSKSGFTGGTNADGVSIINRSPLSFTDDQKKRMKEKEDAIFYQISKGLDPGQMNSARLRARQLAQAEIARSDQITSNPISRADEMNRRRANLSNVSDSVAAAPPVIVAPSQVNAANSNVAVTLRPRPRPQEMTFNQLSAINH